jgi:8-oxo-dGTP pyrophosphatase MutT (NUDIX family)
MVLSQERTTHVVEGRTYPSRPFLAVSAAILRDGKVLVVRRARAPASGVFSLPGGVVEAGETLAEAVKREVGEETALTIEPVALAGYREGVWLAQNLLLAPEADLAAIPAAILKIQQAWAGR